MTRSNRGYTENNLERLSQAGYEYTRGEDGSIMLGNLALSAIELEHMSPADLADMADFAGVPQNYRPSLLGRIEDYFFDKVSKHSPFK